MNTLQNYIESALFHYSTIYTTRFEVLEHLFATLGNGVSLNEECFIVSSEPHPSEIEDQFHTIQTSTHELIMAGARSRSHEFAYAAEMVNTESFDNRAKEYAAKVAENALNYRSRYQDEPLYLRLYPWSSTEEVQPFRKYIGCKCPDFREQVEYFVKTVREAKVEDITHETVYPGYEGYYEDVEAGWLDPDEIQDYRESLQKWKDNIHVVEKVLLGG